jgi:hypothetical protein
MSITGTLPPWEFTITSLRQPARCTLSPISVQARIRVSAERVSVPGKGKVLVRLADRLHRQDENVEVIGDEGDGPREVAAGDKGVDADGQMRPVPLHRRDGQDRDGAAHVAAAEVLGGQVEPGAGGHRWSFVVPAEVKRRAGTALRKAA